MPELPEVETTRRGLEPHLIGRAIRRVVIRHHGMRWPVRKDLPRLLTGRRIVGLDRRSKYLLVELDAGWLILHLGMSGSLRVLPARAPVGKHDHLDIVLDDGAALRMTDPRRFGAVLWESGDPRMHPRLRNLGPEPLSAQFTPEWLYRHTRGRKAPIKTLLMDSQLVCGVGNIYANEALFRAGIHPARAAGRIALPRYAALVRSVRDTLRAAIRAGGSSVRDFVGADGSPGWFQHQYAVYGRQGLPCPRCGAPVKTIRIGQRSAFYCSACQR